MTTLKSLVDFCQEKLNATAYSDYCFNGLQFEPWQSSTSLLSQPVKKLACAVDSGLSILARAVEDPEVSLIIVHHGLIWNKLERISGTDAAKIALLQEAGCALFASHLPLDGHQELGNAAGVAAFFKLHSTQAAFEYQGMPLGLIAQNDTLNLSDFEQRAQEMRGYGRPLLLKFGTEKIEKVGIVTGSGSSFLYEAHKQGVDLFITGEPKHEAYHLAKELNLNVFFAGHYATETFGVRSLCTLLEKKFAIPHTFIDEPSLI